MPTYLAVLDKRVVAECEAVDLKSAVDWLAHHNGNRVQRAQLVVVVDRGTKLPPNFGEEEK